MDIVNSKLLHFCNHAGCRELIPLGERYCSQHRKKANSEKHWSYRWRKENYGKYGRFYHSKRWTKASKEYRDKNYWCEKCLKRGLYRKAQVTDHKIPIRAIATKDGKKINGWEKRWDWSNFQGLCIACHNEKTKEVDEKLFVLDDYKTK